jgi:hypothetical protein
LKTKYFPFTLKKVAYVVVNFELAPVLKRWQKYASLIEQQNAPKFGTLSGIYDRF